MKTSFKRNAAVGAVTALLALMAIVAGLAAPSRPAQAQANPGIFAQQPPAACVCASPTSVFGSGAPFITNCQCGAMSCAAATVTGGVTLHCSR